MKNDLSNAVAGMNKVHFWGQIRTVGQSLGPFRLDLSLPFQLLQRVVLRQGGGKGSTRDLEKAPVSCKLHQTANSALLPPGH